VRIQRFGNHRIARGYRERGRKRAQHVMPGGCAKSVRRHGGGVAGRRNRGKLSALFVPGGAMPRAGGRAAAASAYSRRCAST
jgi:hypothetical protein